MVFIGIGSNLGDRLANLQAAAEKMNRLPQTHVVRVSPVYESEPLGEAAKHAFLNAAIELHTALSPESLLIHLKDIEHELGRPQNYLRWSPRIIDLDILFYDDRVMNEQGSLYPLTIPHPEIANRKFVLLPLLDITCEVNPELARRVTEWLSVTPDDTTPRKTDFIISLYP
jgi:2-amino-4-hydroxy-6-hydroxymethyldihydropteridine diphosphokinase